MKIGPYVEKLEKSHEYKEFHKKHKDAFMAAGFFVLDLETKKNLHQLDFYVPKEKKIAAFTLDSGIKVQLLETFNEKVPEKLNLEVKTDLDALYGILEDEMKNRGITEQVKKIVAVLQNIEGKTLWNLNCVLSGMEILRAHVDDDTQSVLKMEKFSMMELIKTVPGGALGGLGNLNVLKGKVEKGGESGEEKISKADVKEQIKQIDKIEGALEKDKKELEKMIKEDDIKKQLKKEIKEAGAKKVEKEVKKEIKKSKK
jgi:hypothetical protein